MSRPVESPKGDEAGESPSKFKVRDKVLDTRSGRTATVTALTPRGFRYFLDERWHLGPRYGYSDEGEALTDDGWTLSSSQEGKTPPGYKLVLVEPTLAMIDAGLAEHDASDAPEYEMSRAYRAMLAASPLPLQREDSKPPLLGTSEYDRAVTEWICADDKKTRGVKCCGVTVSTRCPHCPHSTPEELPEALKSEQAGAMASVQQWLTFGIERGGSEDAAERVLEKLERAFRNAVAGGATQREDGGAGT